jgi:drug/metabolite transporter (DMT)-like permease
VALWGSAFVPSKIGVLASSPLWFLVIRFVVSGAIALVIARALGSRFPSDGRSWLAVVLVGIFANAVYLGCTYIALRHLAAGVGAVVVSTNPLLLAIIAPYALREPLTRPKMLGLGIGFAGVVAIMFARSGTGTAEPRDVGLVLLGVLGSVASTVVFKRMLVQIDVRMTTALQFFAAALALLPVAVLGEGAPHAQFSAALVTSFVYLVLVMSVGGSFLWFWLLEQGEASRVTAFYYLSPVFGLLIAAMFGEPLSVRDLGGLVAIAVGIAIVQRA